jgi:hypothetical protein
MSYDDELCVCPLNIYSERFTYNKKLKKVLVKLEVQGLYDETYDSFIVNLKESIKGIENCKLSLNYMNDYGSPTGIVEASGFRDPTDKEKKFIEIELNKEKELKLNQVKKQEDDEKLLFAKLQKKYGEKK